MQITFPATTRYHLYAGATDMRKGYNSLCGLVQNAFSRTVLSGDGPIYLSIARATSSNPCNGRTMDMPFIKNDWSVALNEVPVHNSQTTAINLSAQQSAVYTRRHHAIEHKNASDMSMRLLIKVNKINTLKPTCVVYFHA
nr:IS66 family insertion sequence element accessory protein TnpB [Bacteroidota bacterium]